MADQTIDVQIRAQLGDFQEKIAAASAGVQTMATEMNAAMTGLQETMQGFQAAFGVLGAVLAGGAIFKEALGATKDWTGEVVGLARQLGVTTEQASGIAVALEHVGVSTDTYGGLVMKLTRQMRQNGDAFDRARHQDA